MTKIDAFRLIIKALGIYCFIDALFAIIPSYSYSGDMMELGLKINFIYFLAIAIVTYVLLFQTERIIKIFGLAKGFDDNQINTNIQVSDLYALAMVTIGLLLIVNNLGSFVNYCYLAFKKEVSSTGLEAIEGAMHDQYIDYNWWAISGLNVFIGTLMVINFRKLSSLFVR